MADITKSETLTQNRELRSTPGYTNYVTSANKDINGIVSSAFLKRYYSNIDAEIYVNGNWAEDISSIQWDISQQTTPLYGYNSYIFDDVAQGARLINGSFTVAFTRNSAICSVSSSDFLYFPFTISLVCRFFMRVSCSFIFISILSVSSRHLLSDI